MASSTSSSEPATAPPEAPDTIIERAFAREVPALAWSRAAAFAFALTFLGLVGWELYARSLHLHAGDFDDGPGLWAAERRKVDTGPREQVVLLGDSRILYDTDLGIWEEVAGRRPIQLALRGTSGAAFLTDIANDEHFAGLAVVGMTEPLFFSGRMGLHGKSLEYLRTESPSQRSGQVLHVGISRVFAFLDEGYALFPMIEQIDIPNRGDIKGPYLDVWKIAETTDDRQTHLWERIETDARLRDHAIRVWDDGKGPPLTAEQIAKTIDAAKRDCAKIRARGGEVVFLRPPSGQPNRANEELRAPRAKVWDALLRETGSRGIHFEDYPAMQGLEVPEHSHLSRASAKVFTRAYVEEIAKQIPWLESHRPAAVGER